MLNGNDRAEAIIELGQMTNSCFAIMPFAPSYQTLYERVIRVAVEEAGIKCIRADEIFSKAQVTQDIWTQIRKCRFVIAELTGKNPNVLYELGLSHALGKPTIIITSNEEDVPFDLKALRYLYYDRNDPFWGENLKQQLIMMCKKIIDQEEFGSVFDGISLRGEKSFQEEILPKEIPKPGFDLTGVWKGSIETDNNIIYEWNLHLVHRDNILKGALVVSYTNRDKLTIVQQAIDGGFDGDSINIHGTSYSFLEKGNASTYFLDSFQGKVDQKGDLIIGNVFDSSGEKKQRIKVRTLIYSRIYCQFSFYTHQLITK